MEKCEKCGRNFKSEEAIEKKEKKLLEKLLTSLTSPPANLPYMVKSLLELHKDRATLRVGEWGRCN